jgi:Putative zinc-finger
MTCKEAVARTTDYYEGILSSSEVQEIQAHLATCDKCRPYFEHALQMITAMGRIPEPSMLSPKAKEQIMSAFRKQQSRKQRFTFRRPWAIAAAAVTVAILVAVIWIVRIHTRGTVPAQSYREYAVDLSKQLLLRGETSPPPGPPAVFPRARLDLAIHLGLGNQPGPYDVVLRRNGKVFAAASGTTKLENHEPMLRVKMDLIQVPAGEYQLGVRPAGWEWRYYKVLLK